MTENSVFLQILREISFVLKFYFFPILKVWWWIIPPLYLFPRFIDSWLWWRRSINIKNKKYVLLEIKMPVENLKPIKAMENVFAALYVVIFDQMTTIFREIWIEGICTYVPPLSFEIASFGGETHFYIRTETVYQHNVESALYGQYPEVEITEVPDYVDAVPQDIPNSKWNLEVREFKLGKPDCYPIKTYPKFETEKESKEEKRVDPMARLLEGLSMIKEGEQIWIQILATEPHPAFDDWAKKGKEIRNSLVKRAGPKQEKFILQEAAEIVIHGPQEKKKEEERLLPPEMMLTPGEKEIVGEIENKISKNGYKSVVRIIYLAKREVFFKPHLGIPISYLVSFGTANLNFFGPVAAASSKVKSTFLWFLDDRFSFVKKRAAMSNYKTRVDSAFPEEGATSVLNTEEMATIFHFPSRLVAPAPSVPRTESRRGEAPAGLPVE